MIPKRLHSLVRLDTAGIVAGSIVGIVRILVVGEERMHFVAVSLKQIDLSGLFR